MEQKLKLYLLSIESAIKNYPLERVSWEYLKNEPSSQNLKKELIDEGVDFNHLCKYDLDTPLDLCMLCNGCGQ